MAEKAENVIFLRDKDIQTLLQGGKIQINGTTVAYLQGDLIQKRDVVPVGKPGYYHIMAATLGNEFSTAFVIPADPVVKQEPL